MYNHRNGCSFRKLDRADLPLLKSLKEDSWTTTHKVAFVNDEDQNKWFDSTPANVYHFICYTEENSLTIHDPDQPKPDPIRQLIGFLSVTVTDVIGMVGQVSGSIFQDHRGTPWAKKAWEAGTDFAFEMFNLHRLEGEVTENNLAALSMDVKLGYKLEGIRRKAVYKCGYYLDSYVMGFLRYDWEDKVFDRYGDACCNFNYKHRSVSDKLLRRLGVEVPTQLVDEPTVQAGCPVKVNYNRPDAEEFKELAETFSQKQ